MMIMITLKEKEKKKSTNSLGGVSQPTTPPAHPVRIAISNNNVIVNGLHLHQKR